MALLPRRRTDPQELLDELADMDDARVGDYNLYDQYYDGRQDTRLNDRARTYLERHGVYFCENFTETVVDTMAERCQVIGFESSLATEVNDEVSDPVADYLRDLWDDRRLDKWQAVIHPQAVRLGDSFVIVEYRDGTGPAVTWNDPRLIKPVYSADEPDMLELAVKRWDTNTVGALNPDGRKITRLNLYYPDRVEKYYRLARDGSKNWQVWERTAAWVDSAGEPLGVPVFHFRNKPLGGHYGRSRVRQFMPFQDELNKYVIDLNYILDNQGFRQRWVKGVESAAGLNTYPGEIWTTPNPDAAFGEFAADSADGVLAAIEQLLSRSARKMRVPMHLLMGGDMPSGEALKAAEAGLITQVEEFQVANGQTWEDALLMALKLETVFGTGSPVSLEQLQDLSLTVEWKSPHTVDDLADLQADILLQQLGVSKATLLERRGFDPEKEQERRQMEAEMAVQAADAAFSRVHYPDLAASGG